MARLAALLLLASSIACHHKPYRNGTVPRLFGYDPSHVSGFLDKAWPQRNSSKGKYVVETVRRDSRGERLYIVPFEPSYSNDPMLVVSLDGITEKRCPGDWYYLDDDLNCAVWVEGPNSLRSRDGGVIRVGEGIDVDPSGDFLWYQLSYTESAVVSLDRSKEILCTTDLGVSELFARSDRLYLPVPKAAGSTGARVRWTSS
jgi:hypothetical protein